MFILPVKNIKQALKLAADPAQDATVPGAHVAIKAYLAIVAARGRPARLCMSGSTAARFNFHVGAVLDWRRHRLRLCERADYQKQSECGKKGIHRGIAIFKKTPLTFRRREKFQLP
ncbi:MAG: hypothetical protein V4632_11565 [Pseudomonadota bacterium]